LGFKMAPTDSWTCRRCRAVNAAGTLVCGACSLASLGQARALQHGDVTTVLEPPPGRPDDAGWIARESAFLLPEMLLAGGLLLASPLFFIAMLRHGQLVAATVLFIGIAPAMLLACAAFRQKSAGGLYLTSWVTFVAMFIAGLVARLTQ
jgi:hypothetical protein